MCHSYALMSDFVTQITVAIPQDADGQRLDRTLADLLPEHTRTAIQAWIRAGRVTLDGQPVRVRHKPLGGEVFDIRIPRPEPLPDRPEDIPLRIVWEDDHLAVIDKPAGLVMHPGAGNRTGTALNALLHRYPEQAALPRAGIVHRLDKNTTGLVVIARTEPARRHLVGQLRNRSVRRNYLAIVEGGVIAGTTIDRPIGRHRHDRLRMAVVSSGKPAVTRYRVLERFRSHTLLDVRLETGRTHQIRTHLQWQGHPIAGDRLYGSRNRLPAAAGRPLAECLQAFARQALHARTLALNHPVSGEQLCWTAEPPQDFQALLALLRKDRDDASRAGRPVTGNRR